MRPTYLIGGGSRGGDSSPRVGYHEVGFLDFIQSPAARRRKPNIEFAEAHCCQVALRTAYARVRELSFG